MGGVRLLLALAVVVEHTWLGTAGPLLPTIHGLTAVHMFFVVSGFYMALVLEGKYRVRDAGTWWEFMRARALRIYPVYVAVLLAYPLAVLALTAAGPGRPLATLAQTAGTLQGWSLAAVVIANAGLLGLGTLIHCARTADGALYLPGQVHDVHHTWRARALVAVPPAWTLAFELAFYALAPWLARRSTRVLLGVLGLTLAARAGAIALWGGAFLPFEVTDAYEYWQGRFFPFDLAFFVLGLLAYRAYRMLPGSAAALLDRRRRTVTGATWAALLLLPFVRAVPQPFVYPALMAAALPFVFAATRRDARDRTLGDLSYPLYIVHWPIVALLRAHGFFGLGAWRYPLACALALVVAAAALRFVQRPVDAWRERLRTRAETNAAAA